MVRRVIPVPRPPVVGVSWERPAQPAREFEVFQGLDGQAVTPLRAERATLLGPDGKPVPHADGLEYFLSGAGHVVTRQAPFAARHPTLARLARAAGIAGMALGSLGLVRPAVAAEPFGHVSGVAAVTGYEGTDWHSDLAVFNGDAVPATVRLYYAPRGEGPSDSFVPVVVQPGETVFLEDVVATTFATSGAGAVQWEVLDADPSSVVLSATTYNRVSATERYGQFVPGVPWSRAAPAGVSVALPTAADYTDYRTNLGVTLGPSTSRYRVVVRNKSGNLLFNEEFSGVPGSWNQFTKIVEQWAQGQLPGVYVQVIGLDGPVAASTSLVNNALGDASNVLGRTLLDTEENVWLTGAAYASGFAGSDWRSDLEVVNPNEVLAASGLVYFPRGVDNSGNLDGITADLPAFESRTLPDVLKQYFLLPNGSVGAIRAILDPAAKLIPFLQTYNLVGTDEQGRRMAYGQFIPGVNWSDGAAGDLEGVIAGVTSNAQFRANLLLQNTRYDTTTNEFLPSDVTVTLLAEDGTVAAQQQLTLAPGEYRQLNKFAEDWVGDDYRGTVLIRTTARGTHEQGGVNAAVTVVNGNTTPGTNDAYLIPHTLIERVNHAPVFEGNDLDTCGDGLDVLVDADNNGWIDKAYGAWINSHYLPEGCILAHDPDGDTLRYSWRDIERGALPPGFSYNGAHWQWDMSTPGIQPGYYNLEVTISDGRGGETKKVQVFDVRE